jgi:hypothetical protein
MPTPVDDWYSPCCKCGKATSWTCDTMPPESEKCRCNSEPADLQTQINALRSRIEKLESELRNLDARSAGMINFGGR